MNTNLIPKEAIDKASSGGYGGAHLRWTEIALDPNFWRCLGVALGWTPQGGTGRSYHDEYGEGGYPSMYDWEIKAHKFYSLILTGGDVTSYWEEILK